MRPTFIAGTWAALGVATVGVVALSSGLAHRPAVEPSASFRCTVAAVHDGDTLRCFERDPDGRAIRVRLSGIDARELDGSCTPGHPCAAASAESATAALKRLAGGQRLQCAVVGFTYGREAAFCRNAAGVDLSCAMLASGTVARWPLLAQPSLPVIYVRPCRRSS